MIRSGRGHIGRAWIERRFAALCALLADGACLRSLASAEGMKPLIRRIITRVCELPDRTSPDDWPEAMLVTDDELHNILLEEVTEHFEEKK